MPNCYCLAETLSSERIPRLDSIPLKKGSPT